MLIPLKNTVKHPHTHLAVTHDCDIISGPVDYSLYTIDNINCLITFILQYDESSLHPQDDDFWNATIKYHHPIVLKGERGFCLTCSQYSMFSNVCFAGGICFQQRDSELQANYEANDLVSMLLEDLHQQLTSQDPKNKDEVLCNKLRPLVLSLSRTGTLDEAMMAWRATVLQEMIHLARKVSQILLSDCL